MAKPEAVFIYIGTYPSEAAARADYNVVKDLHAAGAVGTYDAAVVTKDDAGKVQTRRSPASEWLLRPAGRKRRRPGGCMRNAEHQGGRMRPAYRPGTRGWLLPPAAALAVSGFAAGCSSTPAYCTAATNLKTSVSNLDNVNVAKNGLSSLQTALTSVQTNAKTFASDAQSAFPSQTTALQDSLSSLGNAIKSA